MAQEARFALLALVLFGIGLTTESSMAQLKVLPGSSARGRAVLVNAGCLNCHAAAEWVTNRVPNLTRTPKKANSASALATALWNHAPDIWDLNNTRRAQLSTGETADLFAYFYSALYFSLPGEPARGRRVFEQKRCADCHRQDSTGPNEAPAISKWAPVNDPIDWFQRMWNHSSAMRVTMQGREIDWPTLSDQNVADLMMYLMTTAPRMAEQTFNIGEPKLGQVVFKRACQSCHSFGKGERTVDLLQPQKPVTVTSYLAAMWNHAPLMRARRISSLPKLNPREMSDLVAFLFSQRYFFEQGNAERGRQVYEKKNCVTCHVVRRNQLGAPDLTAAVELYSPVTMTAAIWRHGSGMMQVLKQEGAPWPVLKDAEMTDLIAYLNSRLRTLVATVGEN